MERLLREIAVEQKSWADFRQIKSAKLSLHYQFQLHCSTLYIYKGVVRVGYN